MALHELSDRELASIIAGLRALQDIKSGHIEIAVQRRRALQAVADNAGAYISLPNAEIDMLCNRLNMTEAKRPDLFVVIEGGVLTAVCSDHPNAVAGALGTIRLIDYDTEGSGDCGRTRQGGGWIRAHVADIDITKKEIDEAMTEAEFNAIIKETPV